MYGLIGRPLGHSFSQKYFTEKFAREAIDNCYKLFELQQIEDLEGLLAEHPDLEGLNVTIPYKQTVIPFLTGLSDDAAAIGAVNVIKISRDADGNRTLVGYNSDAVGFENSLRGWLDPSVRKALVLGTGGASNAVDYILRKLGLETVKVSRTPGEGQLGYDDLDEEVMASHRLIVNTTPVGTFPNTNLCPDIPYHLIGDGHYCYDLVYNPDVTLFLSKSAGQGAKVKNGIDMLHGQAEAAWRIWTSS